jgi:2-C-methyl-D-erythritol 2,4-cyclodiphosphate synthase
MTAGAPCVLAGIEIDCPLGPVGHSDADAVLHALTDALLGGAGMDDLGTLFPDSDPQWQDADSERFLTAALEKLAAANIRVICVDMVVICDLPLIAPHRPAMRARLAQLLQLPVDRVNLKGKTTEGGDGNGSAAIEVQAIAMMKGGPACSG